MLYLRRVVPVVAVLLAGGWLMGEDPKKTDEPKDPAVVPVRVTLPANWKKLGMTDKQTKEVYRIRGSYLAKIDALKQKIADLQNEEKIELEKLLTDAQKTRLKELKLGEAPKETTAEKPPEKAPAKDKPEDKK